MMKKIIKTFLNCKFERSFGEIKNRRTFQFSLEWAEEICYKIIHWERLEFVFSKFFQFPQFEWSLLKTISSIEVRSFFNGSDSLFLLQFMTEKQFEVEFFLVNK